MAAREYVLITGATSGIGYEMARIFAEKKHPLILVGRNKEKLENIKITLKDSPHIVTICQNLSNQESAAFIYQETKRQNLKVTILINNAGAGYVGAFMAEDDVNVQQLITLNMTSLTMLIKYFAQDMIKERKGAILNVASTGSYHPGPYTALYYATKAYVLSLSEALAEELKPYGIVVSSLCPGATATNFAKAAGRENAPVAMSPQKVALAGYRGLMKKKRVIIPGFWNRLFIKIPRSIAIKFIKSYQLKLKN